MNSATPAHHQFLDLLNFEWGSACQSLSVVKIEFYPLVLLSQGPGKGFGETHVFVLVFVCQSLSVDKIEFYDFIHLYLDQAGVSVFLFVFVCQSLSVVKIEFWSVVVLLVLRAREKRGSVTPRGGM